MNLFSQFKRMIQMLLKVKKKKKVDVSVKILTVLDYIAHVLKTKVIVDLNVNVLIAETIRNMKKQDNLW